VAETPETQEPKQPAGSKPRRTHWLAWAALVVLILVVLAIALPNLLRSRMATGEPQSTGTLRTLNTALITYATTYNQGFPESLRKLGPAPSGQPDANNAEVLDQVMAGRAEGGRANSFVKSGYRFTYWPGPRDAKGQITTYTITARPLEFGKTGSRSYFTSESAVIRATTEDRDATIQDPPI
jgi:type II secretory pathway pseudopilin PulG